MDAMGMRRGDGEASAPAADPRESASVDTPGPITHRERMLACIRGEPTDMIPWAPRMDLWAIANRARGTLPPHFADLDLAGIVDSFGFGLRVTEADFYTEWWRPEDLHLRSLGIENRPDFPFRIELADLPFEVRESGGPDGSGGWFDATFTTPAGTVRTEYRLTSEMMREGAYDPYVSRRAIQSPDDIEPVAQVFEHLRVVPTPEGFASFRERVGDRGIAVAQGTNTASPLHLVQHDLMELDSFIYLLHDDPVAIHRLADRMAPFFESVLTTVLASEVEIFQWGTNYDRSVTWPAFFRDEIAPWLRSVTDRTHAAGKLVLTHADGENDALLPMFAGCGLDVAESVCTRPMVRNSLAELRAGFGPATTIWGGIPAVALLPDSMDDAAFEAFLDGTFSELGTGERLILGVSDNVPPDADLSRLERIGERIGAFGPVRAGASG
jgi:hypothetical protein